MSAQGTHAHVQHSSTSIFVSKFQSDPTTAFPCIQLDNLFQIADRLDEFAWKPFGDGVEIHRLYGDGSTGPTAALIHFIKDAQVPRHFHEGYEHILILAGSQTDQNGGISPGTLRIHPPGTSHSVVGQAGCIVLAIYEKAVTFFPTEKTD
jgi:anti-sigma factor ChrR (cupin superfamily)